MAWFTKFLASGSLLPPLCISSFFSVRIKSSAPVFPLLWLAVYVEHAPCTWKLSTSCSVPWVAFYCVCLYQSRIAAKEPTQSLADDNSDLLFLIILLKVLLLVSPRLTHAVAFSWRFSHAGKSQQNCFTRRAVDAGCQQKHLNSPLCCHSSSRRLDWLPERRL